MKIQIVESLMRKGKITEIESNLDEYIHKILHQYNIETDEYIIRIFFKNEKSTLIKTSFPQEVISGNDYEEDLNKAILKEVENRFRFVKTPEEWKRISQELYI